MRQGGPGAQGEKVGKVGREGKVGRVGKSSSLGVGKFSKVPDVFTYA
jgi:hypothetical protein